MLTGWPVNTDKASVTHGVDNWELTEYSWNKNTGLATFVYERNDGNDQTVLVRHQPRWVKEDSRAASPRHR